MRASGFFEQLEGAGPTRSRVVLPIVKSVQERRCLLKTAIVVKLASRVILKLGDLRFGFLDQCLELVFFSIIVAVLIQMFEFLLALLVHLLEKA